MALHTPREGTTPPPAKRLTRCVAVAWSQSQNPSEVCLQCHTPHLTLALSLWHFPCGWGGQRPPWHPRSRAGECAGPGATLGLVGSCGLCPAGHCPVPRPLPSALNCRACWAAKCFAAGCGRVARRVSSPPLANRCITRLVCHQSVSVCREVVFARKQHRTKPHF